MQLSQRSPGMCIAGLSRFSYKERESDLLGIPVQLEWIKFGQRVGHHHLIGLCGVKQNV